MKGIVMAVTAILLAGCASVQRANISESTTSEEHVVDKNYKIAVERTASVGEAMVRVKDYRMRKTVSHGTMHASMPFTLFFPLFWTERADR